MARTPIPGSTRAFVRERDGYTCINCKATDELIMHHILPVSEGGTNDDDNLCTLCVTCHKEVHTERGDWYAGLMTGDGSALNLKKRPKYNTLITLTFHETEVCKAFKLSETEAAVLYDVIANRTFHLRNTLPTEETEMALKILLKRGLVWQVCIGDIKFQYMLDVKRASPYFTVTRERVLQEVRLAEENG